MKNLSKNLLSEAEKKQVEAAVAEAEKRTSGEVVTMIVPASYGYPLAEIIGAAAFALPVSIILTVYVGGLLWMGTRDMWLFMGIFALVFAAFHIVLRRAPAVKRRFISNKEMAEEVEEAALSAFYQNGLYRTRGETGVLLFISVFEHKVWILADRGIHEKVARDNWNRIADMIVTGIRAGRAAEAICSALKDVGELLARHFPITPDDKNELKNLIVQ